MRAICYVSSFGQNACVSGSLCEVCCSSLCLGLEIGTLTTALDKEVLSWYSTSFLEEHRKDCLVLERLSSSSAQHSPILAPSRLRSRCFSCGDFKKDMDSQIRENGYATFVFNQELPKNSTRQSEEHVRIDSLENADKQGFCDKDSLDGAEKVILDEDAAESVIPERHEDSDDKIGFLNSTLEDVRSIIDGDEEDGTENAILNSTVSFLSNSETDPSIWVPPGPADIADDMESVANNDDDDEYSDGTQWVRSSSFSELDTEYGSNFKEERQKAMMEAMNGQFKILVSRFLTSEDTSFSEGEHGEKWLDIVTSLSWEAALLIKPEANEGGAMDPGSYVKVKCIASGARSQSEVIKGLVFKKNTAHKHMPTKFKNPRLLLLKGAFGHREVGLSSLDTNSLQQEKDYLKSIHEMIETCHPNAVLVEKSVSRDMQEFLLAKGMTLVFDMKLTRLNRISRCIGSPVISSSDILTCPKVKQCDMFHIEKFVEEHGSSSEGGKRSSKTLMFLEGFSKPLGCTILLKGAPIVELKKVKRVLQYTVFAAYHLILETSFFVDQRALFPELHTEENGSLIDKLIPANCCGSAPESNNSCIHNSPVVITEAHSSNAPSSNGSLENSIHEDMYSCSNFTSNGSLQFPGLSLYTASDENNHEDLVNDKLTDIVRLDSTNMPDLPWQYMSSFSSSLKKFLSDSFAPVNSESMSSYFGHEEKELDSQSVDALSVSASLQAHEHETDINNGSIQEKLYDEISNTERADTTSSVNGSIEHNTEVNSRIEMQNKDNIDRVLDPQSILVLMSSQCIEKGVVCEQSHLSRIKYYGNFDVSLGHFLRETLLNQNHLCSSCGETPEAHVYSYTHQNGNLTVQVRQLPSGSSLSGKTEGKIWMWTRCLKCEQETGISRSMPRVVMSTAARSLSFGKFLELSFSSHSVASRLSSKCGHSLHRDCLRFFGLGSKVAMFRYSSVEIFAACKPPPVLDFRNPHGREWIKREAKSVLRKGDVLFLEVATFLQKLKHGGFGLSRNFPTSVRDICEVEEMLIREKLEFEASLLRAINFTGQLGKAANEILSLSWLNHELLLELYIWDRRLQFLLDCRKDCGASHNEIQEQCVQDNTVSSAKYAERNAGNCNVDLKNSIQNPTVAVEDFSSNHRFNAEESGHLVPELESESAEVSENDNRVIDTLVDPHLAGLQSSIENNIPKAVTDQVFPIQDHSSLNLTHDSDQKECLSSSDHMQAEHSRPAVLEHSQSIEEVAVSERRIGNRRSMSESSAISVILEQNACSSISGDPCDSNLDPNAWIWNPSSELLKTYRKDLHGGSLQTFEFVRAYTPKYLSPIQLNTEEKESLHFPLGAEGSVISVYEDDISCIISCGLALSEEQLNLMENTDEKEAVQGKGEVDKAFDHTLSTTSDSSSASSFWSSTGSVESGGMHPSRSLSSISSDESSTSGSEGSFFVDRLIASENLHPEIHVGGGKATTRNKCSVVLVHAKQFYALRRMCCPSELAYISSLSRSKKWDAQGGKSKAFFAKTLDDRFIIKQVNRTEIDSFLKFAPEYFRHISYSISSGSQTCLAKILGVYQVRQTRGGKEVKIDVMVMENLLFGRNFTRIYDLKGAVFSRYISDPDEPEKVLLDQNFVEDMRISPMYIAGRNKHLFQRAIWNDTSFLTSINVMDYSLLVGVDKQRRELVFGIIDYLRQYTWDKQLETWVKSSLVVPKNSLPTVISPKEYKKRFRKFMSKYFLTVPDSWSSEQCSDPCKFCNDGTRSSSVDHYQSSQIATAVSSTRQLIS